MTFLIFHELRRQLSLVEEESEINEDQVMTILRDTIAQIPGIQAAITDRNELTFKSESGTTYSLNLQNIVDGLRLLWYEFRESQKHSTR